DGASALLPGPISRMAPKGVAPPADRLAWAILVRLAPGDATLYTGSPTGAVSRQEQYLPSVAMRAGPCAGGVRGREARARLRLLPEACCPLTQGLPLPWYRCAAPTLTVETRSACEDHSPSGGRRGENLVRRGRSPPTARRGSAPYDRRSVEHLPRGSAGASSQAHRKTWKDSTMKKRY